MTVDMDTLSLFEASELIRQGELSPVKLVETCLDRINRFNPRINAFITVTGEQALEQARDLEVELRNGHWRGPLHGIPVGLKDLYETRGIKTTCGTSFFRENIPPDDGFVVRKLREAGAVSVGKQNMHEIALGTTNENPHYGPARNPWDVNRITGGSSGGSAASLVAGMCLGSFGSDTGGSIRIPASLCGCVGIKPTYGRVSLRGVVPLSWSLDHAGPLARRVRDAALLLQAVAGYDPEDPASVPQPVNDYLDKIDSGLQGIKAAVAVDEHFRQADDQVLALFDEAVLAFRELGARVEEIAFPDARQAARANGTVVVTEGAAFHRQRLEENPSGFGEDIRSRLQTGAAVLGTDYAAARREQVVLRRRFEKFFDEYDILLTPATAQTAPLIGNQNPAERARQLTRFTAPFNLTGLPAISLPCGFTKEGLPAGLQIIAGPWREEMLFRAAQVYEQAACWYMKSPALPGI
jgi:aspartyl-tRNA(Asn)/glutamyl-tRNA(Gln) amidotransferase subunit A